MAIQRERLGQMLRYFDTVTGMTVRYEAAQTFRDDFQYGDTSDSGGAVGSSLATPWSLFAGTGTLDLAAQSGVSATVGNISGGAYCMVKSGTGAAVNATLAMGNAGSAGLEACHWNPQKVLSFEWRAQIPAAVTDADGDVRVHLGMCSIGGPGTVTTANVPGTPASPTSNLTHASFVLKPQTTTAAGILLDLWTMDGTNNSASAASATTSTGIVLSFATWYNFRCDIENTRKPRFYVSGGSLVRPVELLPQTRFSLSAINSATNKLWTPYAELNCPDAADVASLYLDQFIVGQSAR